MASFVFLFHAWGFFVGWGDVGPLESVLKHGFLAVDAFFVISGFAISLSLYRVTPGAFVVRRLLRLTPALVFAWLLDTGLILATKARGSWEESWQTFAESTLTNVLPVSGRDDELRNFVVWSLAVEVRFYLLALLMLVLLHLARKPVTSQVLLWATATWIGLLYISGFAQLEWLAPFIIANFAPLFILGITLGLLHSSERRFTLVVLFFFNIPWLVKCLDGRVSSAIGGASELGWILNVGMIALVALATRFPNPPSQRLCASLTQLGQASYPLYLLGGVFGMSLLSQLIPILGLKTAGAMTYTVIAAASLTFTGLLEPLLVRNIKLWSLRTAKTH